MIGWLSRRDVFILERNTKMLELPLIDRCDVIFVPSLLENPLTGQSCIVDAVWDTGSQRSAISVDAFRAIGLVRGNVAHVQGSSGVSKGWETVCRVSLTEYDVWDVEMDVLPELPVHMVIGMDIISTGNFSLMYEENGYTFRFEQL